MNSVTTILLRSSIENGDIPDSCFGFIHLLPYAMQMSVSLSLGLFLRLGNGTELCQRAVPESNSRKQ